ncbi:MAG: hypothetical protein ABFS38_02695 [Bacteroidota bacterium]
MSLKRVISIAMLLLGVTLLLINVFGLFKSLRNEDLYSEITPYKDDISIRFEEAKKQWDQGDMETDKKFAARVTMLVNRSMAHYWRDEGIKKYHMRVPLWENYILAFRQWISGQKKYEFRNYKKVIERGVGICSQPCIGLKYLLNAQGIKADLWDLQGHIVVGVTFDDESEYTLDPDYGYVISFGMGTLQENPELVSEAYKNHDGIYASHVTEHKHTNDIVNMYTQKGNNIYYMRKPFEDFSYYVKWIFPLLLLLPYLPATLLRK